MIKEEKRRVAKTTLGELELKKHNILHELWTIEYKINAILEDWKRRGENILDNDEVQDGTDATCQHRNG